MDIVFKSKVPAAKGIARVVLSDKTESYFERSAQGGKIVLGLGSGRKVKRRKLVLLMRQIIAMARANKVRKLSINFSDFYFPHLKAAAEDIAELLAVNFEMANFQFVLYKTPPRDGWNFVERRGDAWDADGLGQVLERGEFGGGLDDFSLETVQEGGRHGEKLAHKPKMLK